ncbi:hypothetical protein BH11MYX4_BH11MYX4_12160 [soil metagenome]
MRSLQHRLPPQQLCIQKDFEPPYGTCHETCGGSRESILCPVDGSVACVNVAQDSANCGACAHACPLGQHCTSANGTCAPD